MSGCCVPTSWTRLSDRRPRGQRRVEETQRLNTVPDLSSDQWAVLCAVHVGVEGHLEVLRRQKHKWVNAGDTHTHTHTERLQTAGKAHHFGRLILKRCLKPT